MFGGFSPIGRAGADVVVAVKDPGLHELLDLLTDFVADGRAFLPVTLVVLTTGVTGREFLLTFFDKSDNGPGCWL